MEGVNEEEEEDNDFYDEMNSGDEFDEYVKFVYIINYIFF